MGWFFGGVCRGRAFAHRACEVRENAALLALTDERAAALSAATDELKAKLGGDADMWGNPSRIQ